MTLCCTDIHSHTQAASTAPFCSSQGSSCLLLSGQHTTQRKPISLVACDSVAEVNQKEKISTASQGPAFRPFEAVQMGHTVAGALLKRAPCRRAQLQPVAGEQFASAARFRTRHPCRPQVQVEAQTIHARDDLQNFVLLSGQTLPSAFFLASYTDRGWTSFAYTPKPSEPWLFSREPPPPLPSLPLTPRTLIRVMSSEKNIRPNGRMVVWSYGRIMNLGAYQALHKPRRPLFLSWPFPTPTQTWAPGPRPEA